MNEIFNLINRDSSFKELFSHLEGDEKELVKNYVSELSEKVEKIINIYNNAALDPEKTKVLRETLEDIFKTEEEKTCQEED